MSLYEKYKDYIVFRSLIGSRAYGLHTSESDYDFRGVYIAPTTELLGLSNPPEQIETDVDEVYWELGKFVSLALKANPNILEVLFTDEVKFCDPIFKPIYDNRQSFLSQSVYQTYMGYAQAQFHKLNRRQEEGYSENWKHAMHMIRLLLQLRSIITDCDLIIYVGSHKDFLMNIRHGKYSLEELDAIKSTLETEIKTLYDNTCLPEEPNYKLVNDILVDIRLKSLELR